MEVHPHVCGENYQEPAFAAGSFGPSPRVWGKLWFQSSNDIIQRSIPTCVGKTITARSNVRVVQVHPHVCGENFKLIL